MKISQISPIVYSAQNFFYNHTNSVYKGIQNLKTQYVYRFLYINSGRVKIQLLDNNFTCEKGDIIYLIPGDYYKLKTCECDFSMVNVFFDFFPQDAEKERYYKCIYQSSFKSELCSDIISFSDAEVFNKSRVFRGVNDNVFSSCIVEGCVNEGKELLFKIHVLQTVYRILKLEQNHSNENDKVLEIIKYVNDNPQLDLSATALQNKFGYHKNYINQLVKKKTGKALGEIVRASKIAYAKILLNEMGLSLTDTANALGYYDYSHFYKIFKKETGLYPGEFVNGNGIETL